MSTRQRYSQGNVTAPATDAVSVGGGNDSTTYDPPLVALYVGTAGDIKLDTVGGTTVTFTNVPVGILPVQATKVYSTDTAAAGIIGLRNAEL